MKTGKRRGGKRSPQLKPSADLSNDKIVYNENKKKTAMKGGSERTGGGGKGGRGSN